MPHCTKENKPQYWRNTRGQQEESLLSEAVEILPQGQSADCTDAVIRYWFLKQNFQQLYAEQYLFAKQYMMALPL